MGGKVLARVHLLSEAEGGPMTTRQGDYRPNHDFGPRLDHVMQIGRMIIADEPLHPGESRLLEIEFFNFEALEPLLKPGCKWVLREGVRAVGHATVVEVRP